MIRLTVPLNHEEREALLKLSNTEKRDPRLQAAFIIRRELERIGLLPSQKAKSITTKEVHQP